ncbi:GNPAT (predicted) [Pycnogonum litorale]
MSGSMATQDLDIEVETVKTRYKDILLSKESFSDVSKVLKSLPKPDSAQDYLKPHEIKSCVLKSDTVKNVIKQVCVQSQRLQKDVQNEASEILDKMAHDFCNRSFRSLLFAVLKVFRKLFTEIFVDTSGMKKIIEVISQGKIVLLLPTHRSYMDFLLISSILFMHDVPLPVIAATEDFLSMKFLGHALRESGAFFIRRGASKSDVLYWTILVQFMQAISLNQHNPVKFYIEGTRSRTGKSLYPKLGLLQTVVELYLKRTVPDIIIVPISVSYDRTMEESLFAHELLGVPKPKETTSKLFKAYSVFQESYGSIYMSVGSMISVHEFWKQRSSHPKVITPRSSFCWTAQESSSLRQLANLTVKMQQNSLVIFPFNIVAFVVCYKLQCGEDTIDVFELSQQFEWIYQLLSNLGFTIQIKGCVNNVDVVKQSVTFHKNLVDIRDDKMFIQEQSRMVSVGHDVPSWLPKNTIHKASSYLSIVYYANQVLQLLCSQCIICLILLSSEGCRLTYEQLQRDVLFLSGFLKRDFIFVEETFQEELQNSIVQLMKAAILSKKGDHIVIEDIHKAEILSSVISPFVFIRKLICDQLQVTTVQDELIINCINEAIANNYNDYRLISKEVILNGILSLIDSRVLDHSDKSRVFTVSSHLPETSKKLENFFKNRNIPKWSNKNDQTVIPSKL